MVCRALSECLQSMVLKGMCQLSLLTSKKFHHFFNSWIIEEEHDISADRWMSHMGFFDSYPVRMGFGFVPKLTCLIYIRQYSACGPFWPTACCFVSLILCLLILGPFLYPHYVVYVWMISTFWLLPCHTSSANIGCQQKTLEKKKCEVQKASFSLPTPTPLLVSGVFSDLYLQVMAPIRPEPWQWSQHYPSQSVIRIWWLQKQFCSWQRRNVLTF